MNRRTVDSVICGLVGLLIALILSLATAAAGAPMGARSNGAIVSGRAEAVEAASGLWAPVGASHAVAVAGKRGRPAHGRLLR